MFQLRDYQKRMVAEEVQRKNLLVVAPMGAGKTISTLTALAALIIDPRECVENVLIIAPKRVAQSVWAQEALENGTGLNVRYCERALDVKLFLLEPATHHIAVCSVTRIEEIPHGCWDCVVIDESTMMKHHKSKRSKEARRICNKVPRRIELTGTPIHNGYEGLWHQLFLLDGGKAVGRTLGEFRSRYMREKYRVNGVVTIFEIDPARIPQLMRDIKPLVYVVDADVKLPDCLYKDVTIDLPKSVKKKYDGFEESYVMTYREETGKDAYSGEAKTLLAFSRTSLGMKLRQFASGFVYTDDDEHKTYVTTHREKIEALKELVEGFDGGVLVAYQFKSEYEELKKAFPKARRIETDEDVVSWNEGRMPMALVHPSSVGHGLNLQFGGHVLVWFSLTYDAELYAQLNKRLHRSGQTSAVSIIHLIARGTIDERVLSILRKKENYAKDFVK